MSAGVTRADWALFAAFLVLAIIGLTAGGTGVNGLLLVPLLAMVGMALYALLSTT